MSPDEKPTPESEQDQLPASLKENMPLPKSRFQCPLRHWFEIFIPFTTLAWSWTFDMPMELSKPLRDAKGFTDEQIEHLYAAYSLPNLFMGLFFGYMLRKSGPGIVYICLALV